MTMLLYVTFARRSVVLATSGVWKRRLTTSTTTTRATLPIFRNFFLNRQVAAVASSSHFSSNSSRLASCQPKTMMVMGHSFSTDSKPPSSSSSSSSNPKPKELNAQFVTNDPRIPYKQRLKNLFTIYGPVAVVLHIGLSLTFLGATYLVVRYGFDVPAFLQTYGLVSEKYLLILANGGTFALAYALYKAAMPARVLFTLLVTPAAARKLAHFGIIKRRF